MYEKLSRSALVCLYISTAISSTVCVVIILALEFLLFIPKELMVLSYIGWGLLVLDLLNAVVSPWFRYHRYHYKIDEEAIDIVEGYLFQERNIVPIERLHKLEINSGPIDRMCGLAKVTVTTAGGDVTLRFVDKKRAEQITEGLMHRINQYAAKSKEEKR
ncbi:MAG: PH domain-containing protein [Clostridium sp.]|nr:PH domain-containing protein [Clostridium sp.]